MCRNRIFRATIHVTTGHKEALPVETAEAHTRVQAHAIMERGQKEEEIILAFMVSDEALEDAANTNFSLGNCTDARTCPVPS